MSTSFPPSLRPRKCGLRQAEATKGGGCIVCDRNAVEERVSACSHQPTLWRMMASEGSEFSRTGMENRKSVRTIVASLFGQPKELPTPADKDGAFVKLSDAQQLLVAFRGPKNDNAFIPKPLLQRRIATNGFGVLPFLGSKPATAFGPAPVSPFR